MEVRRVSVAGARDGQGARPRTSANFAVVTCADHKCHQNSPKCNIFLFFDYAAKRTNAMCGKMLNVTYVYAVNQIF